MKPFSMPASTVVSGAAGSATIIIVWALKQWGHVEVPAEVASAFTGLAAVIGAHFTTDTPA